MTAILFSRLPESKILISMLSGDEKYNPCTSLSINTLQISILQFYRLNSYWYEFIAGTNLFLTDCE